MCLCTAALVYNVIIAATAAVHAERWWWYTMAGVDVQYSSVFVCVWEASVRQLIARTARLLLLLSLLLHCVAQTESEPYARESVAYECNKRSNSSSNTLYPSTKHDNNSKKTEGKICFHDYFFSIAFCKRLCGSGGVDGGGNSSSYFVVCGRLASCAR